MTLHTGETCVFAHKIKWSVRSLNFHADPNLEGMNVLLIKLKPITNGPQIRKNGMRDRRVEVLNSRGTSGSAFVTNGPLLQAFVNINESFTDYGRFRVLVMHLYQNRLNIQVWLTRLMNDDE